MDETTKKSNKVIPVLALLVVAAAIIAFASKKDETQVVVNNTEVRQEDVEVAKQEYKDGTYTKMGTYTSPGGSEQIEVTVMLKGDVVADAKVVSKATLPMSKTMQENFISGYKQQVVGKKLDEVNFSGSVSGSSLTPKGFNDAIEKIKLEARA